MIVPNCPGAVPGDGTRHSAATVQDSRAFGCELVTTPVRAAMAGCSAVTFATSDGTSAPVKRVPPNVTWYGPLGGPVTVTEPPAAPIWVASAARVHAQAIVQQSSASLRPGDSLRVRVWREPDLSGVFMVDEHGDLTFPRLGRRSVVNVPIDSIRARVQREYAEFVRDASVEITPLYRVRVNGAVRNPGLFTVDPTMSVGDAIGLAGGVSAEGRNGKVDLVRDGRRRISTGQ